MEFPKIFVIVQNGKKNGVEKFQLKKMRPFIHSDIRYQNKKGAI